jgi:hypothetical protein
MKTAMGPWLAVLCLFAAGHLSLACLHPSVVNDYLTMSHVSAQFSILLNVPEGALPPLSSLPTFLHSPMFAFRPLLLCALL